MEKNKKSFLESSKIEKMKNLIKTSEYIKHECDEFNRKKKINEKEIENVLKNVTTLNHKLEKLINNCKYD